MAKIGDIVHVENNPNDPQGKPRYKNYGAVLEIDGKKKIKLDGIPINFNGWLEIFPPRARPGGVAGSGRPPGGQRYQPQQAQQPPADEGFDDEIPW